MHQIFRGAVNRRTLSLELQSSGSRHLLDGAAARRGLKMSRPMALGLVLLVLILTSQSDWKQEAQLEALSNDLPETKYQLEPINREKVKKEIILLQEKEIYKLTSKIQSLELQLKQCQCDVPENNTEITPNTVESFKQQEKQRDDLVEPVLVKASKLRGSGSISRPKTLSDRSTKEVVILRTTGDAFEMAEEEEENIEDR